VLKHYDEPLVVDIGAHIGSFAVPIAKSIAGRQGAVICFEPQRITFLQLCANIFLNRIDNCYPHNCAIADTDGVCEIPEIDFYNCINASAFSMHQKYRELHGIEQAMRKETHSVPQLSLDSLEVDSLVSLVKIDVEGLELQVLTGGIDFLSRNKFPPILLEAWGHDWFESERSQLFDCITSIGYQLVRLGHSEYFSHHPEHYKNFCFQEEHGFMRLVCC